MSESRSQGNVWVRQKFLVFYRMFLLSFVAVPAAFIWKFGWLALVAKVMLGVPLVVFGWGTLLQKRQGFTPHDNFMATLVGSLCLLGGVALLVWAVVWTHWESLSFPVYAWTLGVIVLVLLLLPGGKPK